MFVGNILRASTGYTQPLDTTAALHVMTNRSANAWLNGAIGELVLSGRINNRGEYHAYLADAWGLS